MARGRPADPDISAKVERARQIIEDTGETVSFAAREVGLRRQTLAYRLQNQAVAAEASDKLPDTPEPNEIPVFIRDYSDRERTTVYPIGDLHIGAPGHQAEQLQGWLDFLVDEADVSMLNTGDNTNCALKNSKSESYDEKLTVGQARERQTALFRPLAEKGKIDLIIDGNHEMRVYRATGDSPNAAVASALGINYTPAAAIIRYLVGDQVYDVYLRHGTGGGGRPGGQTNKLHDQDRIIDADIYVSGHTHSQQAFVMDRFTVAGSKRKPKVERQKQLYVCSGSFVGYEDYAATAGYPPAHIGAPRIFLDGTRKDAHASV